MLVNAINFPGPALWQGLMMCAIPFFLWLALHKDGKHIKLASIGYCALGFVLFFVIGVK